METFLYKGFLPDDSLKLKAERSLDRIIEQAPSDARVTAVIERTGQRFHCRIELGSSSCPALVESSHRFAANAIDKAELALMRRLSLWHRQRFQIAANSPTKTPIRHSA